MRFHGRTMSGSTPLSVPSKPSSSQEQEEEEGKGRQGLFHHGRLFIPLSSLTYASRVPRKREGDSTTASSDLTVVFSLFPFCPSKGRGKSGKEKNCCLSSSVRSEHVNFLLLCLQFLCSINVGSLLSFNHMLFISSVKLACLEKEMKLFYAIKLNALSMLCYFKFAFEFLSLILSLRRIQIQTMLNLDLWRSI